MRNGLSISTLKKIEEQFGDFDIKQTWGGTYDVFLRFGYWGRVDVNKLNSILGGMNEAVEEDFYDEDCGWLYKYCLQ